jgi:16S rRNA (uracil1498-N3)-methyltransferase
MKLLKIKDNNLMRTPRLYTEDNLNINQTIELNKEQAQHLIKVLKRKQGHHIILFNGKLDYNNNYGEYLAEITNIQRNTVQVKVIAYQETNTKAKINLELAQCISKGTHFDITLQKAVELGVNIITPIISQRSEQIIKNDNIENKMARWKKIIIHACEQSGRADIPLLNAPIELPDWLSSLNKQSTPPCQTILLTLCTKTNNDLNTLNFTDSSLKNIKVIIGAEGGFDDTELILLEKNNFNMVKLGTRILRTETASIVSLAIIQFLVGNI